MALELLLARADDHQPALRQGLAEETLLGEPPPERGENPKGLWNVNSDPNDLSQQRWGVVAPQGPEGDWLLALIEPLRRAREEAQGAPVVEYRIPEASGAMDGAWAMRWKKEVFRHESRAESKLPRYLLLLGDLHQLPLELQHVLSTDAFVGRLAFSSDAGYEAYVAKVLRWESGAGREQKARMLFYTSRDGSEATQSGYRGLVAPCVSACQRGPATRVFPESEVLEFGGEGPAPIEQLLAQATKPGVLFSLSHGAAGSSANRRERQGALLLPGGKLLMGQDVAAGPFLPGGVWFFFACFSAGTPVRSFYAHWLRKLQSVDAEGARVVSSALLSQGEKPFIAALPQAALANPEGPLAVMGHVDLAWSYGFRDHGRPTPSRFLGVLKALAEGGRAGVALSALQRFVNDTSIELSMLYNQEQARTSGTPSAIDPAHWAELWMVRQDLANYVLLGDPAVRLPLATPKANTGITKPPKLRDFEAPAPVSSVQGGAFAEKVVLELLSGNSIEAVAERHKASASDLRRWEDLYRAAGRAALERLFSGEEEGNP